jgi:hypothetical protein
MQLSLSFSNNTSPSWTHSKQITIDPSSLGLTRVNSLQSKESGEMEQPAPPASFLSRGVNYELHSTESVRRNLSPISTDKLGGVVTETILDLETSQKSSVCLVILFSADVRA